MKDSLLHGLLDVLLRRVELLLEELDLTHKTVVSCFVELPIRLGSFEICHFALGLVKLGFEKRYLVGERAVLLFLLEKLLLEHLDLRLCCLGAIDRGVDLRAQGLQTLSLRSC